jgi:hypothetical protein
VSTSPKFGESRQPAFLEKTLEQRHADCVELDDTEHVGTLRGFASGAHSIEHTHDAYAVGRGRQLRFRTACQGTGE